MRGANQPVVLIVEDERDLADLYTEWLSEKYDVRTAYTGEDALEELDEADEAVRVVLLDRRLPGIHGDEILSEIRSRRSSCKVAMVTAVRPNLDIIEMGFDGYLQKPASQNDLVQLTERLLLRGEYSERMQELLGLYDKQTLLMKELSADELETSMEYQLLLEWIDELKGDLDASLDEMIGVETSIEEHWTALLRAPVSPGQ